MWSWFTFAWHFAIIFGFIVLLYLAATYSALKADIEAIKKLRQEIESAQKNQSESPEFIAYQKSQLDERLASFNTRRKSIFAKVIFKCEFIKNMD